MAWGGLPQAWWKATGYWREPGGSCGGCNACQDADGGGGDVGHAGGGDGGDDHAGRGGSVADGDGAAAFGIGFAIKGGETCMGLPFAADGIAIGELTGNGGDAGVVVVDPLVGVAGGMVSEGGGVLTPAEP